MAVPGTPDLSVPPSTADLLTRVVDPLKVEFQIDVENMSPKSSEKSSLCERFPETLQALSLNSTVLSVLRESWPPSQTWLLPVGEESVLSEDEVNL